MRGRGGATRAHRALGAYRVQLGPRGRTTLSGATIGDDTTLTEAPPAAPDFAAMFAELTKQQARIQAQLDEDAKNRRIALVIAGASALFAAVKLGIIAFPHLRSRVSRSPA